MNLNDALEIVEQHGENIEDTNAVHTMGQDSMMVSLTKYDDDYYHFYDRDDRIESFDSDDCCGPDDLGVYPDKVTDSMYFETYWKYLATTDVALFKQHVRESLTDDAIEELETGRTYDADLLEMIDIAFDWCDPTEACALTNKAAEKASHLMNLIEAKHYALLYGQHEETLTFESSDLENATHQFNLTKHWSKDDWREWGKSHNTNIMMCGDIEARHPHYEQPCMYFVKVDEAFSDGYGDAWFFELKDAQAYLMDILVKGKASYLEVPKQRATSTTDATVNLPAWAQHIARAKQEKQLKQQKREDLSIAYQLRIAMWEHDARHRQRIRNALVEDVLNPVLEEMEHVVNGNVHYVKHVLFYKVDGPPSGRIVGTVNF